MPKFSKSEAIRNGWEIYKKHWLFLAIVTIVSFVIGIIPNNISGGRGTNPGLNVIFWIAQVIVAAGTTRIALKLAAGEEAKLTDLWPGFKLVVKYFLMSLVIFLAVVVGLMFLVVPGIIVAVRLQFAPYFVVDKGMGPMRAVKASWGITKGSVVNLLLFDLLMGLITALGAMVAGIGLLVAAPVTMLAAVWVYRKLSAAA